MLLLIVLVSPFNIRVICDDRYNSDSDYADGVDDALDDYDDGDW